MRTPAIPRRGRARTRSVRSAPKADVSRSDSAITCRRPGSRRTLIVTSPKIRAEQTADIIGERLGVAVTVDDRLADPFDVDIVDDLLTDAGDPERIVLVGHDPDFSDLLSTLCGPQLEMKKGALARIEVERPLRAGRGALRWLIPPDALKDR